MRSRAPLRAVFVGLAIAAAAYPTRLKPETEQAFQQYIQSAEAHMDSQLRAGKFLWTDESADRKSRLQKGEILTEPAKRTADMEVPDGLIHDWVGAVFIPGTTLQKTLALVQNYDNHKNIYKPEVIDSKLLRRNGEEFQLYLRLVKKKVITVVLDTNHEVRYYPIDPKRCYSRSYSTRITEVRSPGTPQESKLPAGQDHGFLWRLDSYWRFEERDGGVYVECRAVSLTRDIPTGLGWMISPIIRSLPQESLEHTLRATRDALTP